VISSDTLHSSTPSTKASADSIIADQLRQLQQLNVMGEYPQCDFDNCIDDPFDDFIATTRYDDDTICTDDCKDSNDDNDNNTN